MAPSVLVTKRLVDSLAAVIGLALTLPLYPILAALVYLDSPGPIFYRQRRAGRLLGNDASGAPRWTEFEMLKFRTMRVDAEKTTGAVLATRHDSRVTRVGRFLRRTRLDEIPQLINVLVGDMSLVGPRPERPELLRTFAAAIPLFEERMRGVRPGITGLAQISLGYDGRLPVAHPLEALRGTLTNPFGIEEADDAEADRLRIKLLYDLAYIAALERLSTYVRLELEIILRTPLVMILGRGQ